jgi:gamma-glutamyltranspeptidase
MLNDLKQFANKLIKPITTAFKEADIKSLSSSLSGSLLLLAGLSAGSIEKVSF